MGPCIFQSFENLLLVTRDPIIGFQMTEICTDHLYTLSCWFKVADFEKKHGKHTFVKSW